MEQDSRKTIIIIGIVVAVLMILTISLLIIFSSDERKNMKVGDIVVTPTNKLEHVSEPITDKKYYDSLEERNAALQEQISKITGTPLNDNELEPENCNGYLE